jgi:subtilisin family serine protease
MFKKAVPASVIAVSTHLRAARSWWRTAIGVLLLAAAGGHAAAAPLVPQARAQLRRAGVVGEALLDAFDRQDRVPVMITFAEPAGQGMGAGARRLAARAVRQSVLRTLAPDQFDVTHVLDSIAAVAGIVTAEGLLRLSGHSDVERIDLDLGGGAHLAEAVPLVRLDVLHRLGFTGEGVTVAVLDTGLDTDHPDLADSLVAERCFCGNGPLTGCCPNGSAEQEGPGSAEDDNGHGTNVAGIITSNGIVAPVGGAPNTKIVAIKVLNQSAVFATSAQVIAGLDWILSERPDVHIVNMSLGTNARFEGDCGRLQPPNAIAMAFARAVDELSARGILVVASSGNQCSGVDMPAPACVANTLSVGAVYDHDVGSQSFGFQGCPNNRCSDLTTHADQVTCFTNSNGMTDVFAPGSRITSTGLGGRTSTFSGTSQASPMTVACAAVLLQAEPTLPPQQLEVLLKYSTTLVTSPGNGLSFPRVDCEQSLAALGKPTPTATPTATATVTPSPSPTDEPSQTPSPTFTKPLCSGDCDRDGALTVADILLALRIALGKDPLELCRSVDADMDGMITIEELVLAVKNLLRRCSQGAQRATSYSRGALRSKNEKQETGNARIGATGKEKISIDGSPIVGKDAAPFEKIRQRD